VSLSSEPRLTVEVSSNAAMCLLAPDPASLQERASAQPRAAWLRTLPPRGESSSVTTCPMTLSRLWATRIKKGLATLGSRVRKVRSRVIEVHVRHANRQHHHSLQNVRACRYNVAHQCSTTQQTTRRHDSRRCDPTRRYSGADCFTMWQSDVTERTPPRPSHHLATTSYRALTTVIGH
jgi:hypothetical protein